MRSIRRSGHLFEQVYEIIWEKILAGEFAPRQRLRDIEVAKQLEISRTPAREAMRKLEQDGILRPLERGGYEVADIHVDDLKGLYRCRAVLEGLAVRDAAGHLSESTLNKLQSLINKTKRLLADKDFDAVLKHNTEFHALIVSASHNPHLMRLIESLQRLTIFHRSVLKNTVRARAGMGASYAQHIGATQDYHERILAALQAGNPDDAAALMQEHLFETAEDMDRVLREIVPAEPAIP